MVRNVGLQDDTKIKFSDNFQTRIHPEKQDIKRPLRNWFGNWTTMFPVKFNICIAVILFLLINTS